MVNKNIREMYSSYSKVLPYWVLNPENKPTLEAYDNYIYYSGNFISNDNDLFRYDERSLDSLTIISKDPDIKYLRLDMDSSTPMISKPDLYTNFNYYVEKVSFYSQGVWRIEFKRDYITLWIQFLQNIRYNSGYGNIRTLTTRTNLIDDNYQFEDEKLKSLPLKISGWKAEELEPVSDILSIEELDRWDTQITAYYSRMRSDWYGADRYKFPDIRFHINFIKDDADRTSFCEYYVFNTEEYGMVYIPRVNFSPLGMSELYIPINTINVSSGDIELARIYHPQDIEKYLVNNKWASQFMGIYILPNWLTTSIAIDYIINDITVQVSGGSFTFTRLIQIPFGINTIRIKSIKYQTPPLLKTELSKKLGVKNKLIARSVFQSLPTYLNYANTQINFQKYPGFIDLDTMIFEYDFIFSGQGIAIYYSNYETVENWIKPLPQQLPSSTSKFAQYIQANQNVLQTGIWVKQEEAKVNLATGAANALVGAIGSGIGLYGFGQLRNVASEMLDPYTHIYGSINGGLGAIHGANQAIQGVTNMVRAQNEVKFEKSRVKAKYADTFNSSTRQINSTQAIDALSKEFVEGKFCDVIIYPIIDNLDIYNDTIVRCGNKTYEYFKLNDLLTVGEDKKFNYFEVNAENFYKETSNFSKIWEHFTYEEISMILDWLESGIRLWKTQGVEYDYQE